MRQTSCLQFGLGSNSLANRSHLDHHFSRINTPVQVYQTLRRTLQSTRNNVLLALDFTLRQPLGQVLQCDWVFLSVVEDDETLHRHSLGLKRMLSAAIHSV